MNASPYQVYLDYNALKNHFTTSYDYFKYNGKINISKETFEKRKDRFYFEKLAKKKHYKQYLLANLLEQKSIWIGQWIKDKTGEEVFERYLKRNQALTY